MKKYFAYIRVSTPRQGLGVSLEAQKEAIVRHAQRAGITVADWFEERETAAKRGRQVFTQMLRLLQQGKAEGVLMHKIDRSARNLRDWTDLGDLVDAGVEVQFVNETLDLKTRGGRLSADIQAIVSVDYIRNLREETRKGLYGRLNQGFYPWKAPPGYLDCGGGKLKQPDPVQAPLVLRTFERYAAGRHSLDSLVDEMWHAGLRNRAGGKINRNDMSCLLNNPFYMGVIRMRSGATFPGKHPPIVSKSLFDRARARLDGKTHRRTVLYEFLFRRLLACKTCGRSLIGERQKGHVYYRCHSRECPPTCVREEAVEQVVLSTLLPIQFEESEKRYLRARVACLTADRKKQNEAHATALKLRLGQIDERLSRLTDVFIDRSIEKELFDSKKASLLMEHKGIEEQLVFAERNDDSISEKLTEIVELAGSAYLLYKTAHPEEKRDLLKIVMSNRQVEGKDLDFMLAPPFHLVAERGKNTNGCPIRDRHRTLDKLLSGFSEWLKANPTARLPVLSGVSSHDTQTGKPHKGARRAA